MDIIIAGAGRVGFRLAQTLSLKHNVYIIDKNKEALARLSETIDILPINGDIENPKTYEQLPKQQYDIFIAVTDSDEVNLISTLIADDIIDATQKIIRLRNPYFAQSSIAKKLGISEAVFPFVATASSIEALLEFPKANNVKKIPFSDLRLISVRAQNSHIGTYEELCNRKFCAVGVERDKKLKLPQGQIKEGDLIYLFGDPKELRFISGRIDTKTSPSIQTAAIFGANLLGLETAKALLKHGVRLKLIDPDPEACKRASETLQERVTVINSKYIEHTLFTEENLEEADMIVSTSNDDEDNIIKSLEAKEHGIGRCVAINNNLAYYDLMHRLGLIAIRGPKTNAYYAILEKLASSAVISEKHYCGGRGAMFVRKVFEDSTLIGKRVKAPKFESLAFVVREGIEPFGDKRILQAGDLILVFCHSRHEEEAKRWIYNL
jgi:trk system potassium uptake protein TrkA